MLKYHAHRHNKLIFSLPSGIQGLKVALIWLRNLALYQQSVPPSFSPFNAKVSIIACRIHAHQPKEVGCRRPSDNQFTIFCGTGNVHSHAPCMLHTGMHCVLVARQHGIDTAITGYVHTAQPCALVQY